MKDRRLLLNATQTVQIRFRQKVDLWFAEFVRFAILLVQEFFATDSRRPESNRRLGRAAVGQFQVLEPRVVMTTIDLSALTGASGFRIAGISPDDESGYSVSGAGDVNGDGFDDLIIGAPKAEDPTGNNREGESYVVFGQATGFSAIFDLETLDGSNGFRMTGIDENDQSGFSVSGAGDFNGDGFDDLIIGAPYAEPVEGGPRGNGESYVVFGRQTGFGAVLDLGALDGSNGFRVIGVDAIDRSGFSVSGAGDVDGDGFDDLIIGAPLAEELGTFDRGQSYLIFGKAGGISATLDLGTLDGTNGFRTKISGNGLHDFVRIAVSSAGDVNGDGFDDVFVGVPFSSHPSVFDQKGASFVAFGRASGFDAAIDLATLDGSDGFRITGINSTDISGYSVSDAGDVNGDGFGDLIIGAPQAEDFSGQEDEGESYVVFGKAVGFGATLELGTLDGTNGFRISGINANDLSGLSVSSAGDVNGDSFDDLIIGAPFARGVQGESYVVFGKTGGFNPVLDLATLGGGDGLRLVGSHFIEFSGFSVSSAGDVNGDGFDDLIVGAPQTRFDDSGASYVVFGGDFTSALTHAGTASADTLTGDSNANVIIGGRNNDNLIGGGGSDVLRGGEGDDLLLIADLSFNRIVGGTGIDTLRLDSATGLTLDLTTIPDNRIVDVENIDLRSSGAHLLVVDVQEILNISSSSNNVLVFRDNDAVNIGSGWTSQPPEAIGADFFDVFTQGAATLKVQRIDLSPPSVSDVVVAGVDGQFAWTPEFIDAVDGAGVGAGNGLGYSVLGGDRTVPWFNVDTIYVRFSEHVIVSDVDLFGVDVPDYDGKFNISTSGSLLTISMTEPFGLPESDFGPATTGIEKLLLRLAHAAVTDLAGNKMDSEFTQRIDLLPGDATGEGFVNNVDVGLTSFRGFLSTTNPGPNQFRFSYDPFFDITADGMINNVDVGLTNFQGFDKLPEDDPIPPQSLVPNQNDSLEDLRRRWLELVDLAVTSDFF